MSWQQATIISALGLLYFLTSTRKNIIEQLIDDKDRTGLMPKFSKAFTEIGIFLLFNLIVFSTTEIIEYENSITTNSLADLVNIWGVFRFSVILFDFFYGLAWSLNFLFLIVEALSSAADVDFRYG